MATVMTHYCDQLLTALQQAGLSRYAETIVELSRTRLVEKPHGDLSRWLQALDNLPSVPASVQLQSPCLNIEGALTAHQRDQLIQGLEGLIPWRKGPFNFFGVHIETEWRSDWKWERVAPHLSDLSGRRVLDVGCGSGYHCWRMLGEGARFVLGIDPTPLFLIQFLAVKKYCLSDTQGWFAPLRMEQLPEKMAAFDTVFSMGVLYHRKSPLNHLEELYGALRSGGELVLETLVVEGDAHTALVPTDRYASMKNVYFLPSTAMLEIWLSRIGFRNIRTVNVDVTSTEEQHATKWMTFHSLPEFLDPQDSDKTIEGYPRPRRAILIANRP